MTIDEAHEVWAKIVKGSQVPQEEILEARKAYEEKIDEWNKLDDMEREIISDQEILKIFNDNSKVKAAADKIISQYKKARELVKDQEGYVEVLAENYYKDVHAFALSQIGGTITPANTTNSVLPTLYSKTR